MNISYAHFKITTHTTQNKTHKLYINLRKLPRRFAIAPPPGCNLHTTLPSIPKLPGQLPRRRILLVVVVVIVDTDAACDDTGLLHLTEDVLPRLRWGAFFFLVVGAVAAVDGLVDFLVDEGTLTLFTTDLVAPAFLHASC